MFLHFKIGIKSEQGTEAIFETSSGREFSLIIDRYQSTEMKLKQEIEKNSNLDIAHQNYMKIKSGKPAE